MKGEQRSVLAFWQDKRASSICHALVAEGFTVGIAGCTLPRGMPREAMLYPDYMERLPEADVVLLPLPTLRSGDRIAFSEGEIPFSALLKRLRRGTVLLCGMLPPDRMREAEEAGMTVYDYYDSEDVRLQNAYLTAEGAISIAMQELSVSLCEAKAAVVGCGRIGSALVRMLRAWNTDVLAMARRRESLAEAEALGASTALLSEDSLRALVASAPDVVFTTVPSRIFGAEVLRDSAVLPSGRKPLYIDLSSTPGSFDPVAARDYGIRLLWALSLPGRYAPDSAGRVLSRRITTLLRGEEVER